MKTWALIAVLLMHFSAYAGTAEFGGNDRPYKPEPVQPKLEPPKPVTPPAPVQPTPPPVKPTQPKPDTPAFVEPTVQTGEDNPAQSEAGIKPPMCPKCKPVSHLNYLVVSPLDVYGPAQIADKLPPRCRFHPILGVTKAHTGCDMGKPAQCGHKIRSVLPGQVVQSGWIDGYGYTVTVRHKLEDGTTVFSKYSHMPGPKSCKRAEVGAVVAAGAKIGCVGETGLAQGCHLHFEIRGAANKGTTYDSRHFLLSNGELKHATLCK